MTLTRIYTPLSQIIEEQHLHGIFILIFCNFPLFLTYFSLLVTATSLQAHQTIPHVDPNHFHHINEFFFDFQENIPHRKF